MSTRATKVKAVAATSAVPELADKIHHKAGSGPCLEAIHAERHPPHRRARDRPSLPQSATQSARSWGYTACSPTFSRSTMMSSEP